MKNIKYLIIVLLLTPMHAKVGWEQIYYAGKNEAFRRIVSSDSLDCLALISRMGFCKIINSRDRGCTWDTLYDETWWGPQSGEYPIPQWVWDIQYPSKGYIYVCYDSGIIKRSLDHGKTFDKVQLPLKEWIRFLHMKDSITGIAATYQEVFITEDGWKTYEEIDVNWKKYIKNVYMHSIDAFAFASSHGEIGPMYYKTSDRGKTWNNQLLNEGDGFSLNRIFFINENVGWIAASQTIRDLYPSRSDAVFKTTDKGEHWELIYNKYVEDKPFGLQDIAFKDEYNGVAVGQGNKIIRTTDGGETWEQDTMIHNQGATIDLTMTVHYLGNKPLIGTFASGIYTLPEFVGIEEQPKRPEELLLYPNPAKNVLNIRLPETLAPTELSIYNILGEKVLSAETQSPEAKLNISSLPAGVYTVRATINGTEYSEKFVKGE